MKPSVQVELSREPDGSVVTRYTRGDGTVTWQRHHGKYAAFFPMHDIVHFAAESGLKLDFGFYALVANGWAIQDFLDREKRVASLPPAAGLVEHLVNLLTTEVNSEMTFPATELNAQLAAYAAGAGMQPLRAFSEGELAGVRSELRRLLGEWAATPPGRSLRLRFGE